MSRIFVIMGLLFSFIPYVQSSSTRATVNRQDDYPDLPQIQVLYVVPSDGIDEQLDTSGVLVDSVEVFQTWLAKQTGGYQLRMDTYHGELDIPFLRLPETDAELVSNGVFIRDRIEELLAEMRFNAPNKIYAVYYGGGVGTESCASAAYPPLLEGQVGAVYLYGTPPNAPSCDSNPFHSQLSEIGYIEFAMLHEILHVMGFVPECAPNHTRQGHTSDNPQDLMYAGDEPWNPSILDFGRDDYYGHTNAGCLDLEDSPYLVAMENPLVEVWSGPCSIRSVDELNIEFVNESPETVAVYWVDYSCNDVFIKTLLPGESYIQSSFHTHPWAIRSEDGVDIIGAILPQLGVNNRYVVPPEFWSGDCSEEGKTPISVEFVNESPRTVLVYWIDYTCAEFLYRTLLPGHSYVQSTFLTHPWIIRSEDGLEILETVIPQKDALNKLVIE